MQRRSEIGNVSFPFDPCEVSQLKTPKHLVLDEDVHRALKKKKTETGVNVKDLGNIVLRSVLERPLLIEAIGERLIASGAISAEQFADLRRETLHDISSQSSDTSRVFQPTENNTFLSGSWEMKQLVLDQENNFQVFSLWARDQSAEPIPPHTHDGTEFFVILTGAILLTIDAESRVVNAPDCQTIPNGASHSTAPLTPDTMMLTILVPPNKRLPSWVEWSKREAE
ncbi:cupin domain-containing protein [Candidatus Bipolaricaulota bacterium]